MQRDIRMKKQKKPGYPLPRLLLTLGLSMIVIFLISLLTFNAKTIMVFRQISIYYMIFLFMMWVGLGIFDTCSLYFFAKGFSFEVTIAGAFKAVTKRIFYNVITPFNFGGQPAAVKALTQYNITYGNAYSIVFGKLFIYSCLNTAGGIISFFAYREQINEYSGLSILFLLSGILTIIMAGIFILGFIYPFLVVRMAGFIEKSLKKTGLLKKDYQLKKRITKEIISARSAVFHFFNKNLFNLLTGSVFILFLYFGRLVMLWLLFQAIGINVDFIDGCVLSALLLFLISFIPTPGSAGLGEALFTFLAARNIPLHLLGVVLLLWRLFYQYIGAVIGGCFSINDISGYIFGKAKPQNKVKSAGRL
ncbi:MAG: flippase-like domain-containing protein [Spirochaetales bacterium]|nr:flippase-like domain-containing protein [Spirochaetales bacterium]